MYIIAAIVWILHTCTVSVQNNLYAILIFLYILWNLKKGKSSSAIKLHVKDYM